jgi:polysaccharide export outer membrane protein
MFKATISILALTLLAFAATPQEKEQGQKRDEAAPETPARAEESKTPPADAKPSSEPALPAKPNAQLENNKAAYIIGPDDVLAVKVWREPELSGRVVVRPDGRVSLPLINEIHAAGLTPQQLADAVTEGLSKYLNKPEVNVAVEAVNSKFYYLQGEVLKPGKYPLSVSTTVLEALVNAGGFQEFANRKKIVIMRGSERFKFNYNDVIKGKNKDQNIELQTGDLIVVP